MREENIFLRKGYIAIPYFYGLIFLLFLILDFHFYTIREYTAMTVLFLVFFAFPLYVLFKNHLTLKKFLLFLLNSIVSSFLTIVISGLIINSGVGAGILALIEYVSLFLIPLIVINVIYFVVLIVHLIFKKGGDDDEIFD